MQSSTFPPFFLTTCEGFSTFSEEANVSSVTDTLPESEEAEVEIETALTMRTYVACRFGAVAPLPSLNSVTPGFRAILPRRYDISYIRTGVGFDYLYQVRDVLTNSVLDESQSETMKAELVSDTIRKAQDL
jgi:hypothetical protein